MEEFILSAKFITGAVGGLFFGYIVGKVMGAAEKAKEIRKNVGI